MPFEMKVAIITVATVMLAFWEWLPDFREILAPVDILAVTWLAIEIINY